MIQLLMNGKCSFMLTFRVKSTYFSPLQWIKRSIWTHYQRLAVSIRRGCSTVESTLFPPPLPSVSTAGSSSFAASGIGASFSRRASATDELAAQFSMKHGAGGNGNTSTGATGASALSPKKSNHSASYSNLSLASHGNILTEAANSASGNGNGNAGGSLQACSDYAVGLLSALPASDHALAYVVLETGVRVLLYFELL